MQALAYASSFVRFEPVFRKYKRFSMVGRVRFLENLALVKMALRNPKLNDGAIVECGTWRGGMAAGLIHAGGHNRQYHFFDSFEGLPPAGELDGDAAKDYQRATTAPEYHDNCSATVAEFLSAMSLTKCPDKNIHVHVGYFENTLPKFTPPPIAVLRLDGDWYSSTMVCLTKLWDHVIPGGIILLDDYYHWQGCTLAVHEFLAEKRATEQIRQGRFGGVAYIRKH